MTSKIRHWLTVIAGAGLAAAALTLSCRANDGPAAAAAANADKPAQAPGGSQTPAPSSGGAQENLPAPTPVPERPAPYILPPPPDYSVHDQGWIGGPLLERAEAAPPGFFANVESSVVWPHLRNELVGGMVTLAQTSGVSPASSIGLPPGAGMPITGDLVKFPGNRLDATVSPRFELGYRFPDGFGEIKLSYRFMDAPGSDGLTLGALGPASQHGDLDVNFVDLDYGVRQFSLGPCWQLRTAVGMRYAQAFFDSQVRFLNLVTVVDSPFGLAPFTRLSQTEVVNNWYLGAHGVLEIDRKLWMPELTLFGRVEGSGMWGRVHQTFKETFVEAPHFTELSISSGVGTPLLATQVGLSWDVPEWNHSRFLIGYQFEMWWQFGRGNDDLSFGTLYDQGLFLRAEFNF
jgi:hypothetical protein